MENKNMELNDTVEKVLDSGCWPEDVNFKEETEFICIHNQFQPLFKFENFSSYDKLLKSVAYVIRFINIIQLTSSKLPPPTGILTSEEKLRAQNAIFRQVQCESYSSEVNLLKQTNSIGVSKESTLYLCVPFMDESGIMRFKTHIANYEPVILPRSHIVTRLIIQQQHVKYLHQHTETVINELNKSYYIPKLRRIVKKVIKSCQKCKNNRAKPQNPMMSALPTARMGIYQQPFTFTGANFFGPINVKHGRKLEKRWGCLFTCLTIRAIHIEIAHGLDTDSFILCFRNFMHRRGEPREMFSDRATNFVGAEKVLKEELKQIEPELIANNFVNPELKWNFNPPASPHMGGTWERLVKSIKNALYSIEFFHTPTDARLNSYLLEVEDIINSRPLTYLPVDSDESEALTPNHFLRGSSGVKPIGQFNSNEKFLKSNWKTSQLMTQRFWNRWLNEYLPTISRRVKWCKNITPLKENDIVIICDPDSIRNSWPKGRVVKVNVGKDGIVRSAMVQTNIGIYCRPTVKLAKLDLEAEPED
uniref:CSON007529 protein n=1 Tax=Culicoides sonorensis TaxID=179676 RepID=A0A336KMY3_CULSO